jgi:hypothetical protein
MNVGEALALISETYRLSINNADDQLTQTLKVQEDWRVVTGGPTKEEKQRLADLNHQIVVSETPPPTQDQMNQWALNQQAYPKAMLGFPHYASTQARLPGITYALPCTAAQLGVLYKEAGGEHPGIFHGIVTRQSRDVHSDFEKWCMERDKARKKEQFVG